VSASVPFRAYQAEIYLGGITGQRPGLPFAPDEWERRARDLLDAEPYAYVVGGAGSGDTMRANRAAFDRWRIVPRMLRDVEALDLSTSLLGADLPAPLLLAPVGIQGILHEDAELATGRAAASLGIPLTLSTVSSVPLEEVAAAMGESPRWFQLYWPRDPELAASLVSRAERAGYGAVVVTLDTSMKAWAPLDLAGAYLPQLQGLGIANYVSDPVFRAALPQPPEEDMQAAIGHFAVNFVNPTLTWDDLAFLREHTSLPIVLKGILHADDARKAAEAGADGIVVSNHGGRQVDGALAALDALPDTVAAVPDDFPVLFDSGVRGGADAVKALALGARAVLLGRPYPWALAVAGEEGVRHLLRCVLAELDLTLGLSGHRTPAELGPSALRPAG
jgi:lactate 2-monooxygenase